MKPIRKAEVIIILTLSGLVRYGERSAKYIFFLLDTETQKKIISKLGSLPKYTSDQLENRLN
jgi:hypothetical protein